LEKSLNSLELQQIQTRREKQEIENSLTELQDQVEEARGKFEESKCFCFLFS